MPAKKLSRTQQAVVDALRSSPLAFVGSSSFPWFRPMIKCATIAGPKTLTEKTVTVLRKSGVLIRAKLSDEQVAEQKRLYRRYPATHGYILAPEYRA